MSEILVPILEAFLIVCALTFGELQVNTVDSFLTPQMNRKKLIVLKNYKNENCIPTQNLAFFQLDSMSFF